MSFSSEVKTELCAAAVHDKACAVAECYGVLLYCNTFTAREIRIVTAGRDFSQRLPRLLKRAFGVEFDRIIEGGEKSKYILTVTDRDKIRKIFDAFGADADNTPVLHVNLGVLEDPGCRPAFLRGAFLAGGSVTDPDKRFHLELVTSHFSVSRECYTLLLELGFTPRETVRAGNHVIYFKQADAIAELLTTLGASKAGMDVVSAKIGKSMSNSVNRKLNCDFANADKVVAAAQEQLNAIKKVDREIGISNLPEGLQQAAFLRIANPDMSLADLALLSDPPVTKSCLNHRLKKLVEMAKQISFN